MSDEQQQETTPPSATLQDVLQQMPGVTLKDALSTLADKDPYLWTVLHRRLKGVATTYNVLSEIELAQKENRSLATILERHRPFLVQPLSDLTVHKVYKKGRQVGVSELSINEVLWFLQTHPKTKWVTTFPREKQLLDFSNTRIAETLKETRKMASLVGRINQTVTKEIGNGSFWLLRSAWESNLGEGVDADGVTFDEVDRMRDNVNVAFEESLQSSPYKFVREISTPSLPGRGIDKSFQASCQYHWFVRCTKCDMMQTVEYPANVVQCKDVTPGVKILEAGSYEYLCRKPQCRGKLDRLHGEWVPKYRDRIHHIAGYHIPQTIVPWQDATQLMQKKLKYRIQQSFSNYCLGECSVGEKQFCTPEMFDRCIAPGHHLTNVRGKHWAHVTVGIDWGELNWVVVWGKNAFNGRVYIIGFACIEDSRDDPFRCMYAVQEFLAPFAPDCVVADSGYGKDRNAFLARIYGDRFFGCWYNPSDKSGRNFSPSFSEYKVLIDRTVALKNVVRMFREMTIGLPDDENFVAELTRHFMNLAPLVIEEDGQVFETVDSVGDDHLAHANGYAAIALEYLEGQMNGFQAYW